MYEEKIMPFLWMQGAEKSALESEIESIYNNNIRAFIVESRTHPDFCGAIWISCSAKRRHWECVYGF